MIEDRVLDVYTERAIHHSYNQRSRPACNELKIRARLEEDIFYPAVRAAIDDDAAKVDPVALGMLMRDRRSLMMAEMGLADEGQASNTVSNIRAKSVVAEPSYA